MIDDILTAIPLGFFLSFMVGPVFFVLLETSVIKGFRAAMVFDLGVILADAVFIAIAYFSSYRLIQNIKDEPALFVFGGLIMLTYGIISLVKVNRASKNEIIDDDSREIIRKDYLSLFLKGFLLNFINIGVLGFWLAIIITIGPKLDMKPTRMLVFFTSVIASYFITDLFKILLAKQLRSKLTAKNIIRIKKIICIILIIFGVALLVEGWSPGERKMVNSALETLEKNASE
ncbi:lysine transporter LysE [Flavobacterium cyanobacteriorum]|uniref:Lysine transporter LysE n=1 Tax=Flavobacterium cyanobacteriorum TaxID=2022802 RepID=A0A255ZUS2_9FLAO|nr:LysE family transporter [Flavobacterium cyanobacteriorum]OYQ45176.1 lysine transporter LysE [Flavobacterium cyanobacteriorum]